MRQRRERILLRAKQAAPCLGCAACWTRRPESAVANTKRCDGRVLRAGECGLHVDFEAVAKTAADTGALVSGPIGQGDWLVRLGIHERAQSLIASNPDKRHDISQAVGRLCGKDEMGDLSPRERRELKELTERRRNEAEGKA